MSMLVFLKSVFGSNDEFRPKDFSSKKTVLGMQIYKEAANIYTYYKDRGRSHAEASEMVTEYLPKMNICEIGVALAISAANRKWYNKIGF